MDIFTWQHIEFIDGGNPYICTTVSEFRRMSRKYKLTKIKEGFWKAEEREVKNNDNLHCRKK